MGVQWNAYNNATSRLYQLMRNARGVQSCTPGKCQTEHWLVWLGCHWAEWKMQYTLQIFTQWKRAQSCPANLAGSSTSSHSGVMSSEAISISYPWASRDWEHQKMPTPAYSELDFYSRFTLWKIENDIGSLSVTSSERKWLIKQKGPWQLTKQQVFHDSLK